MLLALPFPDIDPVIFSVDVLGRELALRWYALAYIVGLVLGWRYIAWLCARPALWGGRSPMEPARAEDLLTWMVVGVILGGRLGFVLFYQPGWYLAHPAEILAVWKGGMSFHGGFLGVVLATIGFARKNGVDTLRLGDAVAAAAPIGLFFGRLANFVNGELWGRPTEAPWGVIFPGADCPVPWPIACGRHPSQLYEAALEGVALGLLLLLAVRRGALARPGRVMGLFLLGYGLARCLVEGFRQADAQFVTAANPFGHVIAFGTWGLTMGQILSLPMIVAGIVLLLRPGPPAPAPARRARRRR
ncbi:prolipoprotein diacylglyceryl transferase [Amaricoccus sp.]|uniref:prolipoprotein diacylglyceryl transferase n=1 Tax=Amaricoccus sp. TaxID=1872485 RepID=UPI001B553D0C|nr:prolipoprotein diacylglyceryl transferase [Amaricoccus sp.]MBP7003211.1 prolipoprotein diacylglyceryl transferase [Amaricoccus sp.]